jgi:MFS family permease
VSEDVPAPLLPAAVGLNSISYNSARVLGPAVGGVIVAAGGAVVAFAVSAVLYLPMLVAQLRRAVREPPRLPPEQLGRAVISGLRYVIYSPGIRSILLRSFAIGAVGGSVHVLMPLISHDLLDSGADVFGFLLGSFGLGAIIGVFFARRQRSRFGVEWSVRLSTLVLGLAIVVVALSRSVPVTAVALVLAGAGWMSVTQACSVSLQMLAPRWVAGRAVACFQASLSGGIAAAGLGWGLVAERWEVDLALLASGLCVAFSILLGLVWPMPQVGDAYVASGDSLPAPDVALDVTGRSGPIIVEIEYRVPVDQARSFYRLVQEVQQTRQRNGAYGLSIARDLADLELWVERYHFPTWHDYLRQRDRMTPGERQLQQRAVDFHAGEEPLRVKRLLERPFGSVRWSDESPDRGGDRSLPYH